MNFKFLTICLMILVSGTGGISCSQRVQATKDETKPAVLPVEEEEEENPLARSADQEYRIGIGDVLGIRVRGETDCSGEFSVNSKGAITFCYLGEVAADGRTTVQLATMLTQTLAKDFIRNPQVVVEVKQFKSLRVFVYGAVTKPGPYVLGEDRTLMRVLVDAGGLSGGLGQSCTITRPSKKNVQEAPKVITVDLGRLVAGRNSKDNILLENGDLITVGGVMGVGANIRVLGEVNKPGVYPLRAGQTVLDAILEAGGFTDYASPNRTRVVRGEGTEKVQFTVKMKDVMKDGEKEKDAVLQAGDMVVVPEAIF